MLNGYIYYIGGKTDTNAKFNSANFATLYLIYKKNFKNEVTPPGVKIITQTSSTIVDVSFVSDDRLLLSPNITSIYK